MSACMMYETVWYDKRMYEDAEIFYHEKVAQALHGADPEVLKKYMNRVDKLEAENKTLSETVSTLQSSLKTLEDRLKKLELGSSSQPKASAAATKPAAKKATAPANDDDDDIDLFGSDDDDAAPVAAPQPKKAKAPLIAKSNIILDVKPWDDETDMAKLEECVRSIKADGLLWGASKLVPVAYGVKKLTIACVVEDEKISTDFLEESITAFDEYVQSMDILAFNKV